MSEDRWRAFFIENDEVLTKDGMKTGFLKNAHNAVSKGKKFTSPKSLPKPKS